MDPNRPHRRPKSRVVEPLPIHVESLATDEMVLPETSVAGDVKRRRGVRNWAAEFSKRTRALKAMPASKKFSCSVCSTKLAAKSCLKRHMRLHTGEKPYKCNSCEEAFTRSDYLRKHELVHIEEMSSTTSTRQQRCTRMRSLNAAPERRYLTRQRVREEAALGHVLQPSLAPKPVKKQLLQQQKKKASGNKQQRHVVSQKKHVLHPKPTPIIRMPLRKTSIPVTTAQTQVEAEDGTASPLPGPSRPGPSSSSFKTCGVCKKIFATAHNLTVHSLVFHPSKENGIGCGICQKRCRSINLLSQHYLHNHGDSKNAAEEAMFMLLNNFNNVPTSSFQNLAFPAKQPAAAAPEIVVDRANIKSDDDDSDVEYVETVIRPPPQTGTEVTRPTRQSMAQGNADAEKRDHSSGAAVFQQNSGFQRRLESRSVANESSERNKTKRRFRCDICWRILESGRHFTQHLHAAHPDNMPLAPFRCMDCPKAYYVKDSLTTHRRRHHTTLLCCIFCTSEHVNRKRLNRHMLTRHFNLIQNLE